MDAPDKTRKLFFGLFVFPLLIAIGMAILLCSVVLLTHEQQTPESLVDSIKTGAPSKRWQKAFELSNELNRPQNSVRNEALIGEIISILKDTERYDTKTRGYMALALGRFDMPQTVSALMDVLRGGEEEVQIYALWSLGNLKATPAVPAIVPFLQNESKELRKIAAYVLGAMQDKQTVEVLRPLLNDASDEVKWNAALSLARLDDSTGLPVLQRMVDRRGFPEYENMSEEQVEVVMINAVKGLALVQTDSSRALLENLSKNEKSLKVRQAAFEAMKMPLLKEGVR